IGGESAPAMRRAARLGDGWYPIGSNPRYPLDSLERYRDAVARLHRYAEACDRDPAGITLAYCALRWSGSGYGAARPEPDDAAADGAAGDGGRRLLTGAPEQVAGDIDALEDLGVRHLVLNFQSAEPAQTLERMAWFAEDVRPLVAGEGRPRRAGVAAVRPWRGPQGGAMRRARTRLSGYLMPRIPLALASVPMARPCRPLECCLSPFASRALTSANREAESCGVRAKAASMAAMSLSHWKAKAGVARPAAKSAARRMRFTIVHPVLDDS
ncbi:MAG: hypothetical protein IH786_01075, partial [Proteobacteria bacterium]|nr:hypothetical protein [Pseudomonadota bacterium]